VQQRHICEIEQTASRYWLHAVEAAIVLEMSVPAIRAMQQRGELGDVRPGRRRGIDVQQLAELVTGRPLAEAVLRAIAEGRLQLDLGQAAVRPPSLIESWDLIR
jgi:hypothetical protein